MKDTVMSELKNTRRATPEEDAHFRAVIGELADDVAEMPSADLTALRRIGAR